MKDHASQYSAGKNALFHAIVVVVSLGLMIAAGEIALLMLNPQESFFPRWEYSPEYGHVNPENARIIHKRPRRWKYSYTTNQHRCRGRAVPMSNGYDKMNIVVLGDSYAMGTAVNDGEEFAAVIARELGDDVDVINTAVGSWGLTQQIRRFYEFGQLYNPAIVILQFSPNDPRDNLSNKVSTVVNGRFVFHNVAKSKNPFVRILSKSSLVQHSQLYSFCRGTLVIYMRRRGAKTSIAATANPSSDQSRISPEESFYNELLETFAQDLHKRGIHFLMIAEEIDKYPGIQRKVSELVSRDLLDYFDPTEWFGDTEGIISPEGHWGWKGHRIIGENVARVIRERYQIDE